MLCFSELVKKRLALGLLIVSREHWRRSPRLAVVNMTLWQPCSCIIIISFISNSSGDKKGRQETCRFLYCYSGAESCFKEGKNKRLGGSNKKALILFSLLIHHTHTHTHLIFGTQAMKLKYLPLVPPVSSSCGRNSFKLNKNRENLLFSNQESASLYSLIQLNYPLTETTSVSSYYTKECDLQQSESQPSSL